MRAWIYFMFLAVTVLIMTFYNSFADQIQIPLWVKNNAKWWSEDQIADSDFVKGIQYLIQQQIIQIPNAPTSSNSQTQIPSWIKTNAGWWANGIIGDEDFVKGIQYLIQINVIHVYNQQTFLLTSSAFRNNDTIPSQYTCDGDNISPPLTIAAVPENAKSLALIVDDVDAPRGTFTHWIAWNIPPNKTQFFAGENIDYPQGITSMDKSGYGGPCPPSGQIHRYFFKLYALNSTLNLNESTTKSDLEQSMNGHVMSQTILIGKYSR